MKLFLDDLRQPCDCLGYMPQRIGPGANVYSDKWLVVKDFEAFKLAISANYKTITHVSFDHDLADEHYVTPNTEYTPEQYDNNIESGMYAEKTGYDCAKWMKGFYEGVGKELPIILIHSMNPIGSRNIAWVFNK